MIESLESRCLLAFTPVTIPPLQLLEGGANGQTILPGTTVAKFQGNAGSLYMGTIDFGDGNVDTSALGIEEGNTNVYDVVTFLGHNYAEENQYTIVATMTDLGPSGERGVTTSVAQVFDAPLTATAVPIVATASAVPQTVTAATFTDADLGPGGAGNPATDYSATVDLGSGPLPATVVKTGAGSYRVDLTTTFPTVILPSAGKKATVLITDTDGQNPPSGSRSTATVTPSVVVNAATFTVSAANPMPTTFVEGRSSAGLVAAINDTNPGALSTDFASIVITWGDNGPTSTGFAVPVGGGKFNIFGVHTYSEEGNYPVSVKVTDVSGKSVDNSASPGTLTVSDAPLTAGTLTVNTAGVEHTTATAITATFSDGDVVNTNPADYAYTINWGDGTTSPASSANISSNGGPGLWKLTSTHNYAEEGVFPITVTVYDTDGGPITGRVNTTLTGSTTVADAPLTPGTFTVNNAGTENATPSSITVTFNDADTANTQAGDYLASIFWGDGSSSLGTVATNGAAGAWKVTATHTYGEESTYPVTVVITDTDGPDGSTAVARSSIGMSGEIKVGDAPLTASPATFTATEGLPISPTTVLATFVDTNTKAPLSDYPAGSVTINWGDGTPLDTSAVVTQPGGIGMPFSISGSSHIFPSEGGPFTGTITVKDAGGFTLNIPLSTTVAEAPLFPQSPPAPPFTIAEGGSVSGTLVSFVNTNPFEPPSEQNYTVTQIDWGDGTVVNNPASATITPNSLGGFDVGGVSHQYTNDGNYTIKVTIKEASDTTGSGSVITNTVKVNEAPLTVSPRTVTGTEGFPLAATAVLATFTDPNPTRPASAYTIQLNYGDGTATVPGMAVSTGTPGSFMVLAVTPHTYVEEGLYAPNPFTGTGGIKVSVFDSEGGPITGLTPFTTSSTANIADAPLTAGPAVTATNDTVAQGNPPIMEWIPFTTNVGKFIDTNPLATTQIEYLATISWGDGSMSQGTVIHVAGDANGLFTVQGTHQYAEEGTYNLTIFANDVGGSTVTLTNDKVVVQDAPLTVKSTGPAVTQEGSLFVGQIVTFTDPNPTDSPSDYTATVNWGDGPTVTLPTSAIVGGGGTFAINASHTYTDEGNFAAVVTVYDTDGKPLTTQTGYTATTNITVQDAPLFPGTFTVNTQGVEGPTSTATAITATFTDADMTNTSASNYLAQIDWGDGITTTGTIASNGPAGTGLWKVTGSHHYAEEGAQAISVTIFDTDGGSSTTGRNNTTVSGTATVADAPLTAGTLTTQAGVEGSVAAQLTATFTDGDTGNTDPTDYVATIGWGDGSASVGTVTANGAAGAWKVNGTHVYNDEGTYSLTVTIVDTDHLPNPGPNRGTAILVGSVSVTDAPLVAGTFTVNTAGTEGSTATAITATFSDLDVTNTSANNYRAQIDWGGGVVTAGTIASNGAAGQWKVTGSNLYAEEGAKSIKVTIWDTDGSSVTTGRNNTTVSGSATVADAAIRIVSAPFSLVATEGAPQTSPLSLAVFQDGNPGAPVADFVPTSAGGEGGSVTVNWGDGTALQTLPASSIQPIGSGFFFVRGTHTYAEDGIYTATITVKDGGGAPAVSTTATVTVFDAPLSDTGNPQKINGTQGVALTNVLLGTLKDADPGGIAADYTGSINWGDGSAPDTHVTFVDSLTPGTFNAIGVSHTYATAGIFNIIVTVTDSDTHIPPPGVPRMSTMLVGTTANIAAAPPAGASLAPTGTTDTSLLVAAPSDVSGAVVDAAIDDLVDGTNKQSSTS
jgi:hypothetical protein